ncbi:unnamed protein product [Adineta ricciae]|uniref:Uncharacterized protein n=1 Tax=Adineta ricciae TaxID=249248 RepID=A0A815U7T1_ADIRI|nr:unnamed protein product [Adineta ricciae]CAF1545933.1 unnamed protein product [Adineta ricciae]
MEIFAVRASNSSSTVSASAISATTATNRECEVADDELTNDIEHEDTAEETLDLNWNDQDEEEALCKQFSLDYTTKAVEFYSEINP